MSCRKHRLIRPLILARARSSYQYKYTTENIISGAEFTQFFWYQYVRILAVQILLRKMENNKSARNAWGLLLIR